MKKLLSLLSVLTISGSAVPTTIAASSYQNQEKLNRNKRNNIFNTYFRNGFSGKISKITEIPYFVKSLGIVEKSAANISTGSVFYATDNGVYLIPQESWTPEKIEDLDNNIIDIKTSPTGSAYFRTNTGEVYFRNGFSGKISKITEIPYFVKSLGIVEKSAANISAGSVFYATDNGVYLIPQESWTPEKIEDLGNNIIDIKTSPTGSAYFRTNTGEVYFRNGFSGKISKITEIPYFVKSLGIVEKSAANINAGSVFYVSDNGVYLIPQESWTPEKIEDLGNNIIDIKTSPTGSAYFRTNTGEVYFRNGFSGKISKITEIPYFVKSLGIVEKSAANISAGSVFYATDNGVYLIPQESWTPEKIEDLGNNIIDIKTSPTGSAYFLESINISNIIKNKLINDINTNTDNAILNELNYLNPNLDIFQLEIKEKENNSFIVKPKNNSNKYFGEEKIYYSISNPQNKIINLDELIKKGIFLNFRDKNQGIIIKEIININKNNLIYSNVTATKSIEPTYTKNSKSICFGTTTLFHNLSEKQNMKTPSCKYTKETTINTQITTGLSKTDSEETRTEQSYSSSVEHNWSFELGVNVHGEAGVWPFTKVSTDINTKVGVGGNYGSSITNTSSETKTLSNTFDFSNSKTNEYKEISEVELPSQEISVNPNQKIKVTASLDEVLAQVTLNLKQDIYGAINAKIITLNNEEKNIRLSIKEIMQKLKQYDLLPQEIIINNNDTITFNGKASRSLKQGFDGNIEFHEVN